MKGRPNRDSNPVPLSQPTELTRLAPFVKVFHVPFVQDKAYAIGIEMDSRGESPTSKLLITGLLR